MKEVKLSWQGHSCFTMEYEGFTVAVDPYADGMVAGFPPLRLEADAVYCSHEHGDHNYVQAVTLRGGEAPADYALAEATCPHDDAGGSKRGMNVVRRFTFGGKVIVHMGDVGCFPAEDVIELIRGCDVLLIPTGGFFTVDAATAYEIVKAAQPRCVIPMHYRTDKGGFDVLSTVADFEAFFPAVKRLGSRELVLGDEMPEGLVVFPA